MATVRQHKTGEAWLDEFMQAQAVVEANTMFLTFKLGQLGAAGKHDKAMARMMLEELKIDVEDLHKALLHLHEVGLNIIANVERNL